MDSYNHETDFKNHHTCEFHWHYLHLKICHVNTKFWKLAVLKAHVHDYAQGCIKAEYV